MNLIRTSSLSPSQKKDAARLAEICRAHDAVRLSLPLEETADYYLLYDKGILLSVLSSFKTEKDLRECSAFTLPSARRKGNFSQLLTALLEDAGEEDLIFAAEESSKDAKAVLKALGAQPWEREYLMEYSFSKAPENTVKPAGASPIQIRPALESQVSSGKYTLFREGSPIGSFRLECQEKTVSFYAFSISPDLRGQGLGTRAFESLLSALASLPEEKRPLRLLLEVSGDNVSAVSLYKKAGLSVTQALIYYLY